MAVGSIFRRYELKYILDKEKYNMLMEKIADYFVADEYGESTILSLYYDTPKRLLIRRSIEHPEYKEKLRVRSYGMADKDSKVYVELKKKYKGVVYKRRVAMSHKESISFLRDGCYEKERSQIINEIDYAMKYYGSLEPSMLLSYERRAYYSKTDKDFRITFDRNVLYREDNLSLDAGVYGTSILEDGRVLMEIKVATAIPVWFANILSELKIYKTSFSKYGTAYMMSYKAKQERMKNCG